MDTDRRGELTRTHRLAGYVWTVGGAAMVVCGIAGWSCLFFGIMIVMAMIPAVYSFLIYRRKMGGKGLIGEMNCGGGLS